MRKQLVFVILISLFFLPLSGLQAQETINPLDEPQELSINDGSLPQWVRDIRRFDIITFGTYPFSMLFANFFYDLWRWYDYSGMDFSEAGRRYAPWPFSGPGYQMGGQDYIRVMLIAAGISITLAAIDLIITRSKRSNANRRAESIPSGTYEIEILPYGENPNQNAEH